MDKDKIDFKKLGAFFDQDSIEWKPNSCGLKQDGKPYAMLLAYITARAIQDRLDNICGNENWSVEYKHLDKGVMCGLSIKVNGAWICKWDGAPETQIEAFKGSISGAFKRAAVLWGIGRYLYDLDTTFAKFTTDKSGTPIKIKKDKKDPGTWLKYVRPNMPDRFLPPVPLEKYIIPFGDFKGFRLCDVENEKLAEFANYLIVQSPEGKPMSEPVQKCVDKIEEYLKPAYAIGGNGD